MDRQLPLLSSEAASQDRGLTPQFVKNCTLSREPEVTQRLSFCGAASGTARLSVNRATAPLRRDPVSFTPRLPSPDRTQVYEAWPSSLVFALPGIASSEG
jgi:hypothetical protein